MSEKEAREVYIQEAVKMAEENNSCITRSNSWWGKHIKIKPTDTEDCCIMIPQEGQVGNRWNPCKEDLLADDWIITE